MAIKVDLPVHPSVVKFVHDAYEDYLAVLKGEKEMNNAPDYEGLEMTPWNEKLRDKFAMHVMSALIAKCSIPNIDMARKAYQIADAMLEVRNDSKSD